MEANKRFEAEVKPGSPSTRPLVLKGVRLAIGQIWLLERTPKVRGKGLERKLVEETKIKQNRGVRGGACAGGKIRRSKGWVSREGELGLLARE